MMDINKVEFGCFDSADYCVKAADDCLWRYKIYAGSSSQIMEI